MPERPLWQSRPLEPIYPVGLFAALRVKIRVTAGLSCLRPIRPATVVS